MTIGWGSALAWRMRRQFLVEARAASVEEVVERLVAVPAWTGDAELAITLRRQHPERGELADALAAGRLLSTFSFRGSMNLMTPQLAADHLAVRAAGRQWERRSWREFYELEAADWPALREHVRASLADGPLTQPELATAVGASPRFRHLEAAFGHSSVTIIKPLAWQGVLSIAPSRDGRLTFRSLEGTPGWPGISDLDGAGPRAIIAYLSAYGPAGVDRVQYWLAEGLSAGRKRVAGWLAALGDRLVELEVAGDRVLCLAEHADEIAVTEPTSAVVLLPGLDQWVLGAGTADTHVVPPEHRAAVTRGAGLVVGGGSIVGTWKIAKDAVGVTLFAESGGSVREALTEQLERLAGVTGRELALELKIADDIHD
jgi:hypothetical protein